MNKDGINIELINIIDHVKKYASIISSVMKVDVEIVDRDMTRIAGTGIYKDQVGIPAKGSVYRDVLKTGKPHVIKEPGRDKLCLDCSEKDVCPETLEISTPIFYLGRIVGVIGLVCTTIPQKERVLNNLDSYLKFVTQVSEFISIKINEENESLIRKEREKLFFDILNVMDNSVVVLDENGRIFDLNTSAMKELKLSPSSIGLELKVEKKDDILFGKEVFEVEVNGKRFNLGGKLFLQRMEGYVEYKILVFNTINKLSADYHMMSTETQITLDAIIGRSKPMTRLKNKILKIAPTKSTVLITGESGTGKELVARSIHATSDRRDKPFIAINCAAIPDALLESELFGYVKGAFSGANPNGRMGKFELANGGVIFLDEIGDMPLYLQVKLLRVLQERTLVRIGSNKLLDLDIRIIAATNIDLKERIQKKKFREDLFYRLNVIPIEIPNLQSRGEDLFLIIDSLIEKYNMLLDKYVHTIDDETKGVLRAYSWPGNVRELENVVEFMINLSDERGVIDKTMLPENLLDSNSNKREHKSALIENHEIITIADMEKRLIENSLKIYGKSTEGKKKVANTLGIGVATLYRKLEKYKIF